MTRRTQVLERVENMVLKTTCYVRKCPLTNLWGLRASISNVLHDINVMAIIITTCLTVGLMVLAVSNLFPNRSNIYSDTILPSSHKAFYNYLLY